MHHLEPKESFSPRSLGRDPFTEVLGAAVWAGDRGHGCGREAGVTVLKTPSFGPGMCRKPGLGKCQAGKTKAN